MSITSAISASVSNTVVNVIKSITTDWTSEEKDVEEASSVVKQVEEGVVDVEESVESDYDPKDDFEQGIADEEEDFEESQDTEYTSESVGFDAELFNEEKVVNSDEFAAELKEAINNVLEIAKIDQEKILINAIEKYKEETGFEPTDDIIGDALSVFSIDGDLEIESDSECDVDLSKEFSQALNNVRAVAKVDQQALYHTICDISYELCGTEPDAQQMDQIFKRIKQEFAEEARQEFLDGNEVVDDDEDSDYDVEEDQDEDDDPNDEDYTPESDQFDYSQDVEEDKFGSEDEEEEDEDWIPKEQSESEEEEDEEAVEEENENQNT